MNQTPSSYASLVAEEIRAEMARQRKTQVQLRKLLVCSEGTANNRYAGIYPYDLDELAAVCVWLDIPIDDMTAAAAAKWRAVAA